MDRSIIPSEQGWLGGPEDQSCQASKPRRNVSNRNHLWWPGSAPVRFALRVDPGAARKRPRAIVLNGRDAAEVRPTLLLQHAGTLGSDKTTPYRPNQSRLFHCHADI